jgi:iron complex outermembrane receptor protein
LKNRILFSCVALCVAISVSAQLAPTDKVIDIQQVTVTTPRLQYVKIGNKVQEIDSMTLLRNSSSSLGELLSGRSGLFVKSYGAAGSMASVSFRGTGANHTALMWNGFPINSVTTGEIDLSLIPVFAANKINVVAGAPSTLFGSGTFGGSIELCSEPDWNKGLNINVLTEAGSFDQYANSLKLAVGSKRVYYSLAGIYQSADNDFIYHKNDIDVKLNHNSFKSGGIIQQLAYKINSTSELQASLWYQQKQKQLPLQIGQLGQSGASQSDSSWRMFASYKKAFDGVSFQLQSGLFYNYLHYTDNQTSPKTDSYINSRQVMNQVQMRVTKFGKLLVDVLTGYTLESAHTQYYGSTIDENEGVVSLAANYPISILTVNASVRKDWMEHYSPKPQYALGFKTSEIFKYFQLKGSVSTRFRKPTFNERYWKPYGDVNIKPESGWGCESTLEWHIIKNNIVTANQSLTAYSNSIQDWIQWVPMPGMMTKPVNYKSVWSRGIEVEEDIKLKFNELQTGIRANYTYTRATILDVYTTEYMNKGQQLIYVPFHSAQGAWNIVYKNLDAELSASYTGYRYTDELENFLHGYTLVNLTTAYTFKLTNYSTRLSFSVLNIANVQYEILNSYAMPGRSFRLSLYFNFKS